MVVLAYYLLSTDRMKPGITYQLLNLVSAILMAIGLYPRNAWFSFALQIVWSLISIIAIAKITKTKSSSKSKSKSKSKAGRANKSNKAKSPAKTRK